MSHYAYVNPYTHQVEKVLVIEKSLIKTGRFGDPKNFKQCSYTGKIGKVYPGIGYHCIEKPFSKCIFVPPRPYLSWNFNETSWSWQPPVPHPQDGHQYTWIESIKDWKIKPKTITILPRPDKSYILNEHYKWENKKDYFKRKFKENKIVKFITKLLF